MKKLGNKIKRIIRIDEESTSVSLRFADGTTGDVSLTHIFDRPKGLAAGILRGAMFGRCFIENGALAWQNGFELCPDALRARLADPLPRATHPSTTRNLRQARRAIIRRT